MTPVHNLLSIASAATAAEYPRRENLPAGPLGDQLYRLLAERNGFYAFESALHVRPASAHEHGGESLAAWNSPTSWRRSYGDIVDRQYLFFAEDAFGHQFAINEGAVFSFNAETGSFKIFAKDLDEWADRILGNYRVVTGHPVLHEWQVAIGAIPRKYRLLAKVPLVLGGEYGVDNLVTVRDVASMEYWGAFACSINGLADGESFKFDDAAFMRLIDSDAGAGSTTNF